MMFLQYILLLLATILIANADIIQPTNAQSNEDLAHDFVKQIDEEFREGIYNKALATWNYKTDITEHNRLAMIEANIMSAKVSKKISKAAAVFDWRTIKDPDVSRQLKFLADMGSDILPEDKIKLHSQLQSQMQEIFSTATICDMEGVNCDVTLTPDIETILATSDNPELLKHVWVNYRNAIGPKVRPFYYDFVELENKAAQLYNFSDTGAYWLDSYETPDIKEQVMEIWEQLKPLYLQLHAYIRFKLREKYGDVVSERGPIPAHLLGNMWAQSWGNLKNFTKPYPGVIDLDITSQMVKQSYTPGKIFRLADDFFTSMNLTAVPESFWEKSMLAKPNDRKVLCHASAQDFLTGDDFRIKQCTQIDVKDLETAHHEMGHVQYYLQYKIQPGVYRSGANDGFHEAIGDLISLSVRTKKHLQKINLASEDADDPKAALNNLYTIGLSKIAILPFSLIVDLWRWGVFSGNISKDEYNCKFWELNEEYQGIEPPVDRNENDFDIAAKYHIVANVPYLRYFISNVIQFQFYRSLCEKAGEYDPEDPRKPLQDCDFYGNIKAGNVLGEMLQMGSSQPWQDAMEVVTGQRKMDAGGLLEYFKPLHNWLEEENKKNKVLIGWERSTKVCKPIKN